MAKKIVVILLLLLFTSGCAADNQSTEEAPKSVTEQLFNGQRMKGRKSKEAESTSSELTVVAENLNVPWAIEKTKDAFYITERTGSIVKVEGKKKTRQEVILANPLADTAEAGLMGFAMAEDFEETNQAYAYYTYTNDDNQFNKVITLHLENNQWVEEAILLDQLPSGPYHNGGRIKIGPDEKLYVAVGDAADAGSAQQLEVFSGKILRMNLDGTIPDDNPFENSLIYSYGHRNVQGLTWLSDETMYASEHGNNANDEINQIKAGENYGWPMIEGTEERQGMITPEFTSGADHTWAPSGLFIYEDKLYVAGLRGNAVFIFDLASGERSEVLTDFGRIRDVYIEENNLYFITNNTDGRGDPKEADDKLYRIGLSELE